MLDYCLGCQGFFCGKLLALDRERWVVDGDFYTKRTKYQLGLAPDCFCGHFDCPCLGSSFVFVEPLRFLVKGLFVSRLSISAIKFQ